MTEPMSPQRRAERPARRPNATFRSVVRARHLPESDMVFLLDALEASEAEVDRLRAITEVERPVLAVRDVGIDAVLGDDFYRCPNTGEWVYAWADERLTLAPRPEPEETP
jgi:hypothetical protein